MRWIFTYKGDEVLGKSNLLKDLVNGTSTLENILLRLKVIFTDLEDEKILEWIDGEIRGYSEQNLPQYRILTGQPMGTYIVNMRGKYTNSLVPLRPLISEETFEELCRVEITDGLVALENILNSDNRDNFNKMVPTEFCHGISTKALQILQMGIKISSIQLDSIILNAKVRLTEVIMTLEKSFDNIDELDISTQIEERPKEVQGVIYNIQSIVFGDTMEVEIGDRNRIDGSKIGKVLGLNK